MSPPTFLCTASASMTRNGVVLAQAFQLLDGGLTLDLGHAESGRGRGSENDPRSRPARTTRRSSAAGLLICIGRLRVRRCAGAQLRAQVAAVETENAELETERDILRQAAKYFAGETNW